MKDTILTGRISTTRKGAGYIDDPDPLKDSIYIEENTLNTAMNGDTVEVKVNRKSIRGVMQPVGQILKVIERAKEFFVGIVVIVNGEYIVMLDDKKAYTSFVLTGDNLKDLQKDDKVYIKFLSWTDQKEKPRATLIKVLGKKGLNNVEMESIVLEKGFEVGFPKAVEKEADGIEKDERIITAEEIAKRRDIRGTETFTIDPFDAKDFDDAISFRVLAPSDDIAPIEPASSLASDAPASRPLRPPKASPGAISSEGGQLYEIGVHIADVSHYVREGTALDKEAVKRGCSVYLVDRTIPMLPEALSNDVCSLNPHEDKLTFSAMFVMNDRGDILKRWFGRTVMNSTHRFTYETAQSAIDGVPANIEKYSKGIQTTASAQAGMQYRDQLLTLNRLAKILQKEKFSNGAIEFETPEIKFRLDAEGKPIGVYAYERLDTHKLVEEFMLLANREVAKFIFDQIKTKGKRDTGAIYRIHDAPDKDKIKNLAIFVKALGFDLQADKDGVVSAHGLNKLLEQIDGKPQEALIRTAMLRSMQKAVYSTKNIGHFGLAFEFYTHFTSPIRRYPDLLVHRVLAKHLHNEPFGDKEIVVFQNIAESSTRREISASEAERESKKLKQVEYMSTRLGKVFAGTITGVTKWGMYVEEDESKSEGMVAMRSLGTDFFVFNEKAYSIVGEKTGKVYTLGDKVQFKAVTADLDKKTLDYVLV